MSQNEITARVHELRELKRMAEELEAQIETLTDGIKSYMAERGADEISGTDWKVSWHAVQSTRFDSKTFKKELPDLYNRYSTTTITRRFSVA